ncbi:beta-1,3-glucosyltransferase isoform X2 [Tribolium castaneum]|nr:PREDICTED: beta-1,3-glucosyltransferase isoform X2 [Tribolium castaneum]XP_015839174.1 PREDICTED: beta-1,3-glucosyltransferase isoform X2 [Tribolium castaneum]|eukprot:XP_008198455.1 PREDICTED: beta-1,3-glucosyltransferase isoform X2 [Tribolium castaneum]
MEIIVSFLLVLITVSRLGIAKDIVIIILSQPNEHHLKVAENLKKELNEQAESLQQEKPVVYFSHKDFPHVGHWTILPLIPQLYALHKDNTSWFFFAEDRTKVNLANLRKALSKYDSNKPLWLGHSLHDMEATIIHHFAFYDNPNQFKFPNPASGIAVSANLLKRLADRLAQQNTPQSDFGIDNAHEFALFVWDKGLGEVLTNEPTFCITQYKDCATYAQPFQQCGELVETESIYFAVKTCAKFHKERVPVVQKTWAKHVATIEFFSDTTDNSIPTINLGIPNTEQGHCAKTLAIFHHIRKKITPQIKWIVLADDDTILGVSRIRQLLTCYNSTNQVALGERYGYNVYDSRGYNYITGGGGIIFSKPLLKKLTEPGFCECPSINTPDDMFLGLCIASLGVSVTHSPLFHQARPVDYPPQYLQTQDAVSFHKHWMIDPVSVYNKWFAEDDKKVSIIRDEL